MQFSQIQVTQYTVHLESGHPGGSSTTCNKTQVNYKRKWNLHKNSQTVKKGAAHAKKAAWKRKVLAQKWLCWSDNGKICNNNNSGEFVNRQHKFAWIVVIKNFAIIRPPPPLLGRHLWFHNFFHAAFFLHGPHLFLQFGCFCVDNTMSTITHFITHFKVAIIH